MSRRKFGLKRKERRRRASGAKRKVVRGVGEEYLDLRYDDQE
jgi:hypothetical protein